MQNDKSLWFYILYNVQPNGKVLIPEPEKDGPSEVLKDRLGQVETDKDRWRQTKCKNWSQI